MSDAFLMGVLQSLAQLQKKFEGVRRNQFQKTIWTQTGQNRRAKNNPALRTFFLVLGVLSVEGTTDELQKPNKGHGSCNQCP
jgi:hypothetical protein